MPGAIRIERTSRGYPDRLRAYQILLDGKVAGRVKRGESVTVETEPGHHELHFSIDWARSPSLELDVDEGQEQRVTCWPNANPLLALYWLTAGRKRYIGAEVTS